MIDLGRAQHLILDATPVLGREHVPILDALERVLMEDIRVAEDLPAADISAVDGYAVHCRALRGAGPETPAMLRVVGEAPAGKSAGVGVGPDEAVRIMTGGLIPAGADAVIKVERTAETNGSVVCYAEVKPGAGIRFRGDSLKRGDVALSAGDMVRPSTIGVLASLRRAYVVVHRKPVVAIISTGDELVEFHEAAAPGKAMSSNLHALSAQVQVTGAIAVSMGIVGDSLEDQKAILTDALRADVIITSGGTSRGKYDLTHKTFSSLGMETRFSNIFMKPGKPTIFGTIGKTLVFGLPGNPVAALLSFDQFVRPALLKMTGHRNPVDVFCDRFTQRPENDFFARLDAFNRKLGGNRKHVRPPQVPLESLPPMKPEEPEETEADGHGMNPLPRKTAASQ